MIIKLFPPEPLQFVQERHMLRPKPWTEGDSSIDAARRNQRKGEKEKATVLGRDLDRAGRSKRKT